MKKYLMPSAILFVILFVLHFGIQSLAGLSPEQEKMPIAYLADEPEFIDPPPRLPATPEEKIHTGIILNGDTASHILSPWLSVAQVHNLALTSKPVFDLRRLRTGREYRITTIDDVFSRFEYDMDATQFLGVDLDEEGFHAKLNTMAFDIEVATIRGSIKSSLSEDMKTSEDMTLAVRLGNLFGWKIDFLRDLRQGDTFSVMVEKRFHNGSFQGYGNILAAEFILRGESFDAYRLEHLDGSADFYNASGENLSRMFLKAPVAFTRMSSGFSLRRYHPILKKYKPHYGVDYAAPTGTPIYAVGNGTLLQVAKNSRSGRHVRIRHGNGYETLYLHMSAFARGIRAGKKVRQGEIIGYIGQSGLATGPHVCFRMRKDNVPIDPNGIKTPEANPLPDARKQEFATLVATLQPQLGIHYAMASQVEDKKRQKEKKEAL